jgi:transcriptional regulator with XRE-family HTH domain
MPAHEEPDAAEVGARIRARREALGLSQAEVGAAIGVQGHQIWRYEDGRSVPSTPKLFGIARRLEVTPEWLLYGDASGATERVERYGARGTPNVEAAIAARAARGRPLPDEVIEIVRRWNSSAGDFDPDLVETMINHELAKLVGRALPERPSIDVPIESDRGQRKLPPTKRRRA